MLAQRTHVYSFDFLKQEHRKNKSKEGRPTRVCLLRPPPSELVPISLNSASTAWVVSGACCALGEATAVIQPLGRLRTCVGFRPSPARRVCSVTPSKNAEFGEVAGVEPGATCAKCVAAVCVRLCSCVCARVCGLSHFLPMGSFTVLLQQRWSSRPWHHGLTASALLLVSQWFYFPFSRSEASPYSRQTKNLYEYLSTNIGILLPSGVRTRDRQNLVSITL